MQGETPAFTSAEERTVAQAEVRSEIAEYLDVNQQQMLPLLISCFCAYAVAEYLRNLPI